VYVVVLWLLGSDDLELIAQLRRRGATTPTEATSAERQPVDT
jgi:hypothetical protein